MKKIKHTLWPVAAVALAAAALLGGCQKQTETVVTPSGTRSTTSIGLTPDASQQIGRAGDAVADSVVTAKVKTALLADADVQGLRIEVETRDGAVTLTGDVGTQSNLNRATAIAKGIDGVKSVDNRVVAGAATASASAVAAVKGATEAAGRALDKAGDKIGDAALSARVKAAFLADADVRGLRIDVDTRAGVVTLRGALDQRAQVEKAAAIARRVDGVQSVDNQLTARGN